MVKKQIKLLLIASTIASNCFAITKPTTVIAGMEKAQGYLDYAIWAMAALAVIAVGFMLFNSHNDPILKHIARWVALACVLALAYSAPGWFGLNIIL